MRTVAIAALFAAGCAITSGVISTDERMVEGDLTENFLTVRIPVENSGYAYKGGTLKLELLDAGNRVIDREVKKVTISPGQTTLKAKLKTETGDVKYYGRVRFVISSGSSKLEGVVAVSELLKPKSMQVLVFADESYLEGSYANVSVLTRNPATGKPLAGAKCELEIAGQKVKARTGKDGTAQLRFKVPPADKEPLLKLKVVHKKHEKSIERTLSVTRAAKTFLVTDKPLYQPGQTIYVRSLTMRQPDMTPLKGKLTYEIYEPQGNRVSRKELELNEYGVGSLEFRLADEVNLGEYRIVATAAGGTAEKTVRVERYVLPKFEVSVNMEEDYYKPGETLKGSLDSKYFFGKPVAGGQIEIAAKKFDVGFETFTTLKGKTDKEGHYDFEIELPDYFTGTPFEKGEAFVILSVAVTDKADHTERTESKTKVVSGDILMDVIPESGALSAGVKQRLYVVSWFPSGKPASDAAVSLEFDGKKQSARADQSGVATFEVSAKAGGSKVKVSAKLGKESASKELDLAAAEQSLFLRPKSVITGVGRELKGEIVASTGGGLVFLDVVKGGQTYLTKTLTLKEGRANFALSMGPELSGSISLSAYLVTHEGDIIRDSRLIYCEPADELSIALKPDKEQYRPGETARLTFTVTDQQGKGVASALGFSMVDQAVFALTEMRPGLEKVYFRLEEDIRTPKFEIHGFEPEVIVGPPLRGPKPNPILEEAKREKVVGVMFAKLEKDHAERAKWRYDSETPEGAVKYAHFNYYYQPLYNAYTQVNRALEHYNRDFGEYPKSSDGLKLLREKKYISKKRTTDPWGSPYRLELPEGTERWQPWGFHMTSAGPDEKWSTYDDIRFEYGSIRYPDDYYQQQGWGGEFDEMEMAGGWGRGGVGFGAGLAGGADLLLDAPMEARAPVMKMKKSDGKSVSEVTATGSGRNGGGGAVKVREYFPETMLFEPLIITNGKGVAVYETDVADAITTWKIAAWANTKKGAMGSSEFDVKVFQPFFVDPDLPVSLTAGDEISVPVAVHNYTDRELVVKVTMEKAAWFRADETELTLTVPAKDVAGAGFDIEVVKFGLQRVRFDAVSVAGKDAVVREIRVHPDGQRFDVAKSGLLSKGKATVQSAIPKYAVRDASKLMVRVYSGFLDQAVDGLEKMLGAPYGCFEQTSSTTYPNILILHYLRQTGKDVPEVAMTASEYISLGYQKLITFEVKGGGFSWFGDSPANKVLTAYGLMEFVDMSEVHDVDEALISRTRQWLLSQQAGDGHWEPDANFLHQESWGGIQASPVAVTAYIAWSLSETGYEGSELSLANDYLEKKLASVDDPYVLGLMANSFTAENPKSKASKEAVAKLLGLGKKDGEGTYWDSKGGSVTFSKGAAQQVETTALVAQALIRAGKSSQAASAIKWLIGARGSGGYPGWPSTQGTVLTLRVLNRAEELGSKATGTVYVKIDGKKAGEVKVEGEGETKLIDLGSVSADAHNVELEFRGEGSVAYDVMTRFYVPWEKMARPKAPPLSIALKYDKTTLKKNDRVKASVTVRNLQGQAARLVMVDLGLPPGFMVETDALQALVADETIEKFTVTHRQLTIYLDEVRKGEPVKFSYSIRALYPLKAKTGESAVWEYYSPDSRVTYEPESFTVKKN